MLKGIPKILSPDLLKILMEMGHGDQIVIADGNFPSANYAQRLVRLDGHNVPEILDAILQFFPLDPYVEQPVGLMEVVKGDNVKPVIWDTYKELIAKHGGKPEEQIQFVERFTFYEKAKQAYAVIATGEEALYANVILQKGVVVED